MKTLRTAPITLLALALALAIVGSSCSTVNPVALEVDGWSVSNREFQDVLDSWADVYAQRNGEAQAATLRATTEGTWAADYTAFMANQLLQFRAAQAAVEERGLEVTQEQLDEARTGAEDAFVGQDGESLFDQLPSVYQEAAVEGLAAQQLLQQEILTNATSEEALRRVYDADPQAFATACASHILVLAGQSGGQAEPSDEEYAAALERIEEIQGSLRGAENFAEVAAAESDDGSAAEGGELGCNPKGAYVAEFDEAVWSQPVGEVGEPVRTVYGYHLVLVTQRDEATFEQARSQIAAAVQQNARSLLEAELAEVARGLDVTVDGRYGRFDAGTGQITTPEGAQQPAAQTPSLADLEALLQSGATQ